MDSESGNSGATNEQLAYEYVTATGPYSYGGSLTSSATWDAFVTTFKL